MSKNIDDWPLWANWRSIAKDGTVSFWVLPPFASEHGTWFSQYESVHNSKEKAKLNQYQKEHWPNGMLIKKLLETDLIGTPEMTKAKLNFKTAPDFLKDSVAILEERGKQYDSNNQERSMGRAVEAFNAITGNNLTDPEGWLLLQLLKDVRQWAKKEYHEDSALDCIAYAALKAEALNQHK